MTIQTMTVGYARMGKRGEVKRAVYNVHSSAVPSVEQTAAQELWEDINATSY